MEKGVAIPGVIYYFDTKNLVSFEDNLKYKIDMPLVAHIDFETTAPTDSCLDHQQKKMFAVSYVIAVAFHLELEIVREIIEGSFGHWLE